MKYIIAKACDAMPLFWGRDGWASNSHWASRYATEEAAKKAIKILSLESELGINIWAVEARES